MERGYIKLWNKLKDSRSYSRGGVHRAVLLTIFAEATRRTSFFKGVELKPGQMAVSVMGLAEDLGFPRTTVQRALADLATDGVVTVENMGNRWTRITLVNWHAYQVDFEQCGQPVGNQRATDGQPVGTLKDIKNIKPPTLSSLRSERDSPKGGDSHRGEAGRFYPPTVGEVQAYCDSRGSRIDPQAFVDFYQSKGWKVGRAPMKDWRAAVRTWERKQKAEAEPQEDWKTLFRR